MLHGKRRRLDTKTSMRWGRCQGVARRCRSSGYPSIPGHPRSYAGDVEFRILGPLEVRHDGRPLDLGRPKQRALLAVLLVHANEVVSSDRLCSILWADEPPGEGLRPLRVQVSRLRKALAPVGERLASRRPGYVLRVEDDELDARVAEKLVGEARRLAARGRPEAAGERLAQALGLWRGAPLAEFEIFEFAAATTARLEELRVQATEDLMEARLARGEHQQLVGELESLVADHPFRERLWAARILALYRADRQADALGAYRDLRRILGEELGIEPSAALTRLEESVLLHRRELEWQPPAVERHNLPVARSRLIGRETELAALGETLEVPGLLTLVGPGGVGKTHLALEAARMVASKFPAGIWRVDLAGSTQAGLVVRAVAEVVGSTEEPGRRLLDTLVDALRTKCVLLILDNCEHVIEEVANLADALLAAAPALTVLATSRERLRVAGERVHPVPPLAVPGPDCTSLASVLDFAAVQLFVERARQLDPRFAVTEANAAAVASLTRRLDGIPLAMELAAARTLTFSADEIVSNLDDRFRLLRSGMRGGPVHHASLQAAVEWSYDLLSELERALFRRLSAFVGGFTLESARAVCSGEGIAGDSVLDLLSRLVDCSLVSVVESDGGSRYVLLETLRAYACDRAASACEDGMWRSRHLVWAVALVEGFESVCGGPQEQPRAEQLRIEYENLRAALAWAIACDSLRGLWLAGLLGNYWTRVGDLSEGRRWMDVALAAAVDAPLKVKTFAVRRAGVLALLQGDWPAARRMLEAAADGYRKLTDPKGLGHAMAFLGEVAYEQGDLGAARLAFEEAAAILHGLGDVAGAVRCRARIGITAAMQGDFQGSRPLLMDAVDSQRLAGDTHRTAISISNLGSMLLLQGDVEAAEPLLQQAVVLHRRMASRVHVAESVAGLGELALYRGCLGDARHCFEESLKIGRDVGVPHIVQLALVGLGAVATREGEAGPAGAYLSEVQTTPGAVDITLRPLLLERLAALAILTGHLERAAELLGAAQTIRLESGTPRPPLHREHHEQGLANLRSRLDASRLESAWRRGATLSDWATTASPGPTSGG